MRIALILFTTLLSLSAMAKPFPSLTQFLFIGNSGDDGLFRTDLQEQAFQKIYPFLDFNWVEKDETLGGFRFDARGGVVIVGHGKMSVALRHLKDIKGIQAASVYEMISGTVRSDVTYSVSDVIKGYVGARGAESQAAVFNVLNSEAFKARIKSLTAKERYFASANLHQSISTTAEAMTLLESQMEYASHFVLGEQKLKNLGIREHYYTLRDAVNKRSEIQYARKAIRKHFREATRLAYLINGRGSDAELAISSVGERQSAFFDMAETLPRNELIKKVSAFFSVVEKEIKKQLRLGHEYAANQNYAVKEARRKTSHYGKIMEEFPVRMTMFGLGYGNAMSTSFHNDSEDFNSFSGVLFSDQPKWRILLELLNSSDPAVEKMVSDRLLKIIETFEIPISQLMNQINEAEIEVRAADKAKMYMIIKKNKTFEQLLEEQKEDELSQGYAMSLKGLHALSSTLNALMHNATMSVYDVSDFAYARRAERSLRMLLRIKAQVRTPEIKAHLKSIAEKFSQDTHNKKKIAELANINPIVGTLAAEFTGVKEISWVSPRSRALVVTCDQVLSK